MSMPMTRNPEEIRLAMSTAMKVSEDFIINGVSRMAASWFVAPMDMLA